MDASIEMTALVYGKAILKNLDLKNLVIARNTKIIRLTGRCNNRCWHCTDDLDGTLIPLQEVLSEIKNEDSILIKGGEPLMHPGFNQIIDAAEGKWVGLVTNGRAFSMHKYADIVRQAKIDFFVKLSGFKEAHDMMTRAEGSFTQTMQGIENLVEMKRRVFVLYEITEQNFIYIDDILTQFDKIGVAGIIINYAVDKDFGKLSFRFSDVRNQIKKAAAKIEKKIILSGFPICQFKFIADHIPPGVLFESHDGCEGCVKREQCCGLSDKYIEMFGGDEISLMVDKPSEICIEVTSECNLDCVKCFNKSYYKSDLHMDFNKFCEFIDKIPDNFTKQIRLTGGEPLLHKDIFKMMEYVKQKGHKIFLNTNGVLVNKSIANRLAGLIDNVLVSLNGYDRQTEIRATRYDNFKRKIAGIKNMQDAGINVVRCGTVATETNVDDLEHFYSLILKLGLDDWEVYRPIEIETNDLELSRKVMVECARKLKILNEHFNKDYKIANAIPFCINDDLPKVCIGARSDDGLSRFVVGADGIVRPSYFLSEKIGTINDRPEKIWNNKIMKKIREYLPDYCATCIHAHICKGGSRYFANLHLGDYFRLDPMVGGENGKDITRQTTNL